MSDDAPLTPAEDQQRRIERAEAAYTGAAVPEAAADVFDPGGYTVAEVAEYLTAHPEDADRVIAAERAGKNRVSIVGDE